MRSKTIIFKTMKTTLELKHLAPYIPYELKILYKGIINGKELGKYYREFKEEFVFFEKYKKEAPKEIIGDKIGLIKKVETYKNYWKIRVGNGHKNIYPFQIGKEAFLILHPLSDLTKEIEHNGKKIVPIEEIRKEILIHFQYENSEGVILVKFPSCEKHLVAINNEIVDECPLGIYKTLIKYHFDVFGLIEKGLAIDINTLNNI